MSDEKVREGLKQCNLCNIALVSAIKERVDAGEQVKAVCEDYARFQEQLHGEVLIPATTLRTRYYRNHPSEAPRVSSDTPERVTPTRTAQRVIRQTLRNLANPDNERLPPEITDQLQESVNVQLAFDEEVYENIRAAHKHFSDMIKVWREHNKPFPATKIQGLLDNLEEELHI